MRIQVESNRAVVVLRDESVPAPTDRSPSARSSSGRADGGLGSDAGHVPPAKALLSSAAVVAGIVLLVAPRRRFFVVAAACVVLAYLPYFLLKKTNRYREVERMAEHQRSKPQGAVTLTRTESAATIAGGSLDLY